MSAAPARRGRPACRSTGGWGGVDLRTCLVHGNSTGVARVYSCCGRSVAPVAENCAPREMHGQRRLFSVGRDTSEDRRPPQPPVLRQAVDLGEPALPTMGYPCMEFSRGSHDPIRTTANQQYVVVEGEAGRWCRGRTIEWSRGDIFVVPAGHRCNTSPPRRDPFRVSDEPLSILRLSPATAGAEDQLATQRRSVRDDCSSGRRMAGAGEKFTRQRREVPPDGARAELAARTLAFLTLRASRISRAGDARRGSAEVETVTAPGLA